MDYEKKTAGVCLATGIVRRLGGAMLAIAILFTGGSMYDMFAFTNKGMSPGGFPGFEALMETNPDTAAWICMDGTHIDHPVVQGEDNFVYLTRSFEGEYYQGGCIFLDASCSKDLSDDYLIIHGHHMSGGAMFSDLSLYLEKDFFEKNDTGELITPGARYALTVCGAGTADAYDTELYHAGPGAAMPLHLIEDCVNRRDTEFEEGDKLVVLSTCYGDMTTSRTVVFCRARKI